MHDIYLITKNELLVTVRTPFWIFYGLFQPIVYLLLFGPLLNGVSAIREPSWRQCDSVLSRLAFSS